jgi:hypothetical protein
MKQTHQEETLTSLVMWAPELLLLLTDIFLLAASGHGDEVAGASVAGIFMGAVARFVRAPTAISTKMAEAYPAHRRAFLSQNAIWALCSIIVVLPLWLWAAEIERVVALPGIAGYMKYAAPGQVLLRVSVVGWIATGVNQALVKERIKLSWGVSLANVAFTVLLVNVCHLGAEGAALGTLLAEILPTWLILKWAVRDGLIGMPRVDKRFWLVVKRAKRKTWTELPATLGSVAAIAMNSWLGEEMAKLWVYSMTAIDVVGGVAMCIWGIASKHYTYHATDACKREEAWAWGDRRALVVMTVGAVCATWFAPMAGLCVISYALCKRLAYMRERENTQAGYDAQGNGKLAYTACCLVGYTTLVSFAAPSVWAATAVFLTANTAYYFAMRR